MHHMNSDGGVAVSGWQSNGIGKKLKKHFEKQQSTGIK